MLESPDELEPAPRPSNHPTSATVTSTRDTAPENAPAPKRMFEFLRIPPVGF